MPTRNEYLALGNAVNTEWTYNYKGSGVAGLVCTDKTDSSKMLFFPACGYCYNDTVYNVGRCGYYWSSSLYINNSQYAYSLYFSMGFMGWYSSYLRIFGFPVRGVVYE
jgi:hypothetical protein